MSLLRNSATVVFLLVSLLVLWRKTIKPPPETWMSTDEIIKSYDYPVENHFVHTSDGYVLNIHRIPPKSRPNAKLHPLVLVHGMFISSADFVMMGDKRGLGFLAADAGYDVWMLNMRFTRYATHANLSRDQFDYWDFSMDEHGRIDTAESLDYVLNFTGAQKVHYVGISLGSITYAIMCDVRPDLAGKIASFVGLTPSFFLSNLGDFAKLTHRLGVYDFLRSINLPVLDLSEGVRKFLATTLCVADSSSFDVCWKIIFFITGENYDEVDWTKAPIVFNKLQPSCTKVLEHLSQVAVTGELSRYDYGADGNVKHYGTEEPAKYNLTKSIAPAILYFGENDFLLPVKDKHRVVEYFKKANVLLETIQVGRRYNHGDFVWGKSVATEVYQNLLEKIDSISTAEPMII